MSTSYVLKKDNEIWRMIGHHFDVKCKNQNGSSMAYKGMPISYSQRIEKAKDNA